MVYGRESHKKSNNNQISNSNKNQNLYLLIKDYALHIGLVYNLI